MMKDENNPFLGLLGMSEMEWAVEKMLEMAEAKGVPFPLLRVHPEEFIVPDRLSVLVGFCQLVAHGWLVPSYPNSTFVCSQGLIERMRTRKVWADLPDVLDNPLGFMEAESRKFPALGKRLNQRDNPKKE